jgi:hypothetical protein
MTTTQQPVSTFAMIVDKLRTMDEAQLKLEYIRLLERDLTKEWENITSEASFGDASDEDIVAAIQKKRYGKTHD